MPHGKTGACQGDAEAFDALAAWKERHHHLHEWETNLRDQVMRHRKEIYRRFVADLLRTHGRVFLEDLDLRTLARQESPEEDTYSYSGSMRVVASVSLLARLFHERGDCVRIARATTRRNSVPGAAAAEEWDAAGQPNSPLRGMRHSVRPGPERRAQYSPPRAARARRE